jgi:hypothetical protein
MKKFLVLFVGLAVLAGSVSALDLPDALKIPGLVVTGDVKTGFRVSGSTWDDYKLNGNSAGDADHADPVAYAYSDDPDNGAPLQAQLQLVWTRGNLGVNTRFRYRPGAQGQQLNATALLGDAFFVNKAFVWGDVFDKKVRLTVGMEQDAAWGFFSGNLSSENVDQYDGKNGAKIEIKPIDGLNLGAFYGTGDLFAAARKAATKDPAHTDDGNPLLVVGAKYNTPTFGITASLLHRFNFAETTVYENIQDLSKAEPNTSNLLVGIKLAPEAIPLTVNANLGASSLGAQTVSQLTNDGNSITGDYNSGDYNPYTFFYAKLNFGYGVSDALSLGLAVKDIQVGSQYYYALGDADNVTDQGLGRLFPITISPSLSYAINDDVEVGGELQFRINKNGTDQFGFGVNPSATFQLGSGAWFNVYDEIVFYTASKYHSDVDNDYRNKHPGFDGAFATKAVDKDGTVLGSGMSGTENTFHIEFGWSF